MVRTSTLLLLGLTALQVAWPCPADEIPRVRPPNIVVVLCDDLGYGDVHCLNPEHGKIPTPNLDRFAAEGMIFKDAHSGASVCTPTRYGLLTGRYSWRTSLQSGVVQGFAPSLISADRPTLASFLRTNGYTTAVIGKWHLNFRYINPNTGSELKRNATALPPVKTKIPDGPIHRGFDYFHGFHHAGSMKAVIENDCVIEHEDEERMLPRLAQKSVEYIQSRKGNTQPFFLYVPLNSPHFPIVPTEAWQGKSGLGSYGDFVMQTDDVLGQICRALEAAEVADETLVIFTSDNGCSRVASVPALAKAGHHVSADFRGLKSDIWDGGHRVPFIVRWPGKVKPGSTSDELICLTDLFATAAAIVGESVPKGSCEDSVSFLPALSGKAIESSRQGIVHHSISGHFAYRTNRWKFILAKGSGGWSSPKEEQAPKDALEAQLYDMHADPEEKHNLYSQEKAIAKQLLEQLSHDVEAGRSTAGPKSTNDIRKIKLWKSGAKRQ